MESIFDISGRTSDFLIKAAMVAAVTEAALCIPLASPGWLMAE